MNDTQCAVPGCSDNPFIYHPLPLCRRDALTVSLNVTDVLHATALAGHATPALNIERVTVAPDEVWKQSSHQPVVYFLGNGDRVKIGTSTNIAARVGALSFRKANALLLLQGGHDLENALHNHFQADRIGRTEWFALSSQIRDYIANRKKADEALRQPTLPDVQKAKATTLAPVPEPRKKSETAEQKILRALDYFSDALDLKVAYVDKAQISALIQLEGPTLDNALSRLVKAGKAHRPVEDGKEVRGRYGFGPAPTLGSAIEDDDWPTI